ncbi:MAG: M1 family aminopeptidase [Aureibaculum sp.]|nr:M1 family aminopeptidase [Aureibaculum sp.]
MKRMGNILLILLLFVAEVGFSQKNIADFNQIIEAEAKAAHKIINYKANINTSNYDVTYHRFDWTVDPAVAFISGIVTTSFTAKDDLTTITFDLTDNMTVSAVTQNGNSISYTQNSNDELVIALSQTLLQGQSSTLKITYSGNPVSSGFGSFEQTAHNGSPVIWTLSEPYGAKGWWPCKQDLNDKIDEIDVYITAPQQYVSVSNGLEISQTTNGGFKTTHFKHQYPIPAYLIAIAVTNYSVYSHEVANNGNPFDIVNYVYPEDLTYAQANTGVTVDIMNLYTQLFEEYPYANEKYGHAQFGWNGGMEHTTVSFMGGFSRGLIAHELAHQWFGNKITCGSWKDIWLNEGFATYLSGLTIENLDGDSNFKNWRINTVNSVTSSSSGAVYLSDSDTTSVNRIFNGRLSYNKGAMVLHMLRKKLGDAVFFQGMKNYLSNPNLAFNYAKTPDFISNMEAASGENLTEFFNDWIYNQGYPSYSIDWYQPQDDQIKITVNQTQSHASVSYFEAPLPIRINGTGVSGNVLELVLNNTFDGEEFLYTTNFIVRGVDIDPDTHLISRNNSATLGLENVVLESEFSIYPNPASTNIFIDKPANILIEKIAVFNLLGQVENLISFEETIEISQLIPGFYFMRIQTNQGTINRSFLKH